MTLQNFPRGGRKPCKKPALNLLTFPQNSTNIKNKKNHSKKSNKNTEVFRINSAGNLTNKSLSEGMIILGRIYETTEYDMIISLPGRLSGRINITDISESYTKLLKSMTDSGKPESEEFISLYDLYHTGDYIVCFIKSLDYNKKWSVSLSLEPHLLNQHLNPKFMVKGSMIACTVSNVEDHGYVMETGMANIRAFLEKKNVADKNEYYLGKQIICAIKTINIADNICTLKLSTYSKHTKIICQETQSLDNMIPGTKYSLTVKRILSNGLEVLYNGENTGYINQIHLEKSPSAYVEDTEIIGTLLYIMPILKFAYFSCLPDKENRSFHIGEIIEEATFLGRESNNIILKLDKTGTRGLVSLCRTNIDYNDINSVFIHNSKHRCRIMSYDWMDRIYSCSMEKDLLAEKRFSYLDFHPGELVKVKITKINYVSNYMSVVSGRVAGFVPPEHVDDNMTSYSLNQEVDARVLRYDEKQKKIVFTLKQSLVESNMPVLSDINNAKVGSIYHGFIWRLTIKGLLVRFFGSVVGIIPMKFLLKLVGNKKKKYTKGEVYTFEIQEVDVKDNKVILQFAPQHKIFTNNQILKKKRNLFKIGQEIKGVIVDCSYEGLQIQIEGSNEIGFLPAGHISPCIEVGSMLAFRSTVGDSITALVFVAMPSLILTTTFIPQKENIELENVNEGDIIICSAAEKTDNVLQVLVPINGFDEKMNIPLTAVSWDNVFHNHQILFAKVMSINKETIRICLSMKLNSVWDKTTDEGIMCAIDVLRLYLNTIYDLSKQRYYTNKPLSSFTLGQKVTGKIDKITDFGLVLNFVDEFPVHGIVRKDHYSGSLKIGDTVPGAIIWIDYVHEIIEITLLPAYVNSISSNQQGLGKEIVQGTQFRADILLVTTWFVLVLLKGAGSGTLAVLPARRHLNEVQPILDDYSLKRRIRCFGMLDISESNILLPICILKTALEKSKSDMGKLIDSKLINLKRMSNKNEIEGTEAKRMKVNEETTKNEQDKKKKKRKRKKKTKTNSKTVIKSEDVLDSEVETEPVVKNEDEREEKKNKSDDSDDETKIKGEKTLSIPECGFYWDSTPNPTLLKETENSNSSEEETDNEIKKKKKLSAAERREFERKKEREIREREEALASSQMPNSVDTFDRLVLSSPDSSLVWLQYMAYHLQATEIEKARAVVQRAIKTISFREEDERLNVWQAWLNLESRFGTMESLNQVFQEAVRTNDAAKIYLHMLTVHSEASRYSDLMKMINTIIGKFKQDPEMWIQCGTALLKVNLADKSRHIMQRALQSLPTSQHINVMVRFARLENQFGNKERAQTLFEQVLSTYPKRTDVWIIYIDALVKSGNIEIARKVFERAIAQPIPAKKMKTIYKKFISFEERHGTHENVDNVRKLAVKYVEEQCEKHNT